MPALPVMFGVRRWDARNWSRSPTAIGNPPNRADLLQRLQTPWDDRPGAGGR